MSWQRFEGRMAIDRELFTVTIFPPTGSKSGAYLSLNRSARAQVVKKNRFCDVYLDRAGKRVGLKFLAQRADLNSYIVLRNPPENKKQQARISASLWLRELGIVTELSRRRKYSAELKQDADPSLWWFSIAPLMNGNSAKSA